MNQTAESISVFDMFKIGVGPSSSHTLGPWKAGLDFLERLYETNELDSVHKITVKLYGSLAKTGKGHGTDIAIQMGLMGANPETIPVDSIMPTIAEIAENKKLNLNGTRFIDFNPVTDIEFHYLRTLPFHPNGMTIIAETENGKYAETYFSIGGGFIKRESQSDALKQFVRLPFPIERHSATTLNLLSVPVASRRCRSRLLLPMQEPSVARRHRSRPVAKSRDLSRQCRAISVPRFVIDDGRQTAT